MTDEGGASCPFSLKFKVVTISRVTGGKCYLAADNRVYSTLVVLCLLPPPQIFPKMSRLSIGKVEWREKNLARKKNQFDFLSLMISVAETYLIKCSKAKSVSLPYDNSKSQFDSFLKNLN